MNFSDEISKEDQLKIKELFKQNKINLKVFDEKFKEMEWADCTYYGIDLKNNYNR